MGMIESSMKSTVRKNASDLVLIVMIAALLTLLVTRFFLQLFGWPTISFGVWHIAHVLWGGLLMILGAIFLLTNYGEKNRQISAIVIGAGWGLFIDEIGKYLTKNNDYWFQPAIIFIYISFILLFLAYRHFIKQKNKNNKNLYEIIDQLEVMAQKDDVNQKEIILKIKKIIGEEKQNEEEKRWKELLVKTGYYSYSKIFRRKFILTILGIFSGAWAIERMREIYQILSNPQRLAAIQNIYQNYDLLSKADVYMIILKIIFDAVVAIFFLVGLFKITRKKKNTGLKFFQWGLIVNIFLSSVFKLYFEQFSEVFMIGISILMLTAISRLKNELYS